MSDTKVKQHYVPQMYLRNFCFDEKKEYCYEYSGREGVIRKKSIRSICYEKYLYEIRENGEYIFPDTKNRMEDAFEKIEYFQREGLQELLEKVCIQKNGIDLVKEERELLMSFVALMIFRNPVTKNLIPDVTEDILQLKIEKNSEKEFLWLKTLGYCWERLANELLEREIVFLKTNKNNSFITSSIPFSVDGESMSDNIYMPLSPEIAILITGKRNAIRNNVCKIILLTYDEVERYNRQLFSDISSIIAYDHLALRKIIMMKYK